MAKFGKRLVEHGLVESHFGNISVRTGSEMLITKTRSPLDGISGKSVVEVDIDKPSSLDNIASSEVTVHRSITNTLRRLRLSMLIHFLLLLSRCLLKKIRLFR